MADGKVKISELSQALQLNDNAVFPYTQDNGGTDTTFKAPMTQIARKINEDMDYTNLETSSKKVVGAINQTVNNFAEVYDPTSTYNQNDPVLYGGTLYKCNANNVTGAWDSTKWDEAKAVEFGSGGGGASYATELPISSTDPTDTKSYIDTKTTLVKSASGDLITITDGGDNIPLKSCEVTINPDLSGKTECNLVVCGFNLWDGEWEEGKYDITTGAKSSSGNRDRCKNFIGVVPNTEFCLYKGGTTDGAIFFYDKNQNYISYIGYVSGQYNVFTTPANCYYVTFIVTRGYCTTACVNISDTDKNGTTEAYKGTVYNIPFGQTVYGGEGDMLTGEFESTFGFIEFDGSNDEDWHLSSTYDWNVYINIPSSKPLQFGDMLLCKAGNNIVPTTPSGYIEENKCNISTNRNFQIGILGTLGITTLEDWRTWLSSNHIKVAFTLETPTSLSLTPVNPKTISGINNIYNDCGSTEIEYFTESADGLAALINVLSTS